MNKHCPHCKREFPAAHVRQKYCSRSCTSLANVGNENRRRHLLILNERQRAAQPSKECVICGTLFKAAPSKLKGKNTCSKSCSRVRRSTTQIGMLSHRWRGGKTDAKKRFRNSSVYKHWRGQVFERDNYTCQMCGARGGRLAAHHIITFESRRDLALEVRNGIALCWGCHGGIHGREREYQDKFFEVTGGVL